MSETEREGETGFLSPTSGTMYIYICIYKCMYIYVCMYKCVAIYICIYIYIYVIYTYAI
jgi:hypothetical protein